MCQDNELSAFTPARLSPVPVAEPDRPSPLPLPLPYDLTWRDLRPCLPAFARADKAWVSHAIRGLHKETGSRILTLRYVGVDGATTSRTLFVKDVPAGTEAAKYRLLAARGFPTTRLLHVVRRGERDVLVLEFLATIGIEPYEADDLLALVARLNTVDDVPAELFAPRPGTPGYDLRVKAALHRLGVDSPRWLEAYHHAAALVEEHPRALNHGELFFQQVGWSTGSGQRTLVLFDLETVAMLPRFADIANLLRALARLSGRGERELFGTYLRHTDFALDEADAWREVRFVRAVRSFEALPWLVEVAGNPDVAETPAQTLRGIRDDLASLDLPP